MGKISNADLQTLEQCTQRTRNVAEALRKSDMELLDEELTREFLEADMLYHHTIMQAAGNVYAMKIISTGQIRNRAFGYKSHRRDLSHVAWVYRIHKQIVRALRTGDKTAGAEYMRTHINRSMTGAVEAYDRKAAMNNPLYNRTHHLAADMNEILKRSF